MSPVQLLAQSAPAAPASDFSNDSIGLMIGKAVAILLFLLLSVLFALWFERRVIARMQQRLGPNVRGPWGLVQSIPDALKLVLKEDITVKGADKVIYFIAPLISVVTAFLVFAVIPFGPEARIPFTDIVTPLQLTDLPVAVLYFLGVTALGVYGIVLGGWSSGSTYPLLGSVRSTAQVISYELSMSLALVSVLIVSGSMATSQIVAAQETTWWAFALLPAFVVYFISMVGEVNRLPFDLPEAEGELVAGYQTEYSSMKFAWFYLAEYINMLNVSAIMVTVFFGGWRAPWPLSQINDGMFNEGWWPVLTFVIKLWMAMFVFVWLRGTLLRFRYDQFMHFGWKVLIPVSLVWVIVVAVWQAVQQFTVVGTYDLRTWLFAGAGVLLAIALVLALLPEKKKDEEDSSGPELTDAARRKQVATTAEGETEGEYFDAFAGGFPVPPLPGQKLPPSPRKIKVATPAGETDGGAQASTAGTDPDDQAPDGKESNDG
ncbi:NADH-quinone oxidoreductase subunit NuoH [Pseudactinotalea sp. Z1732]|uniref:NADH-quinone oxidoreductase subunit NuoH n=1 Tax=Micrococcales TaxID=85006 RepID=UPI003C7D0726